MAKKKVKRVKKIKKVVEEVKKVEIKSYIPSGLRVEAPIVDIEIKE